MRWVTHVELCYLGQHSSSNGIQKMTWIRYQWQRLISQCIGMNALQFLNSTTWLSHSVAVTSFNLYISLLHARTTYISVYLSQAVLSFQLLNIALRVGFAQEPVLVLYHVSSALIARVNWSFSFSRAEERICIMSILEVEAVALLSPSQSFSHCVKH